MVKDNSQSLPESPASVTTRVVTDLGFHLMFTLRGMSTSELMGKLEEFQKEALSKGWKPEANQTRSVVKANSGAKALSGNGKPSTAVVVQTTCSICGAQAVKKSGVRRDGSLWEGVFCSTGDESHKIWLN